jgi:hypothetical protein
MMTISLILSGQDWEGPGDKNHKLRKVCPKLTNKERILQTKLTNNGRVWEIEEYKNDQLVKVMLDQVS